MAAPVCQADETVTMIFKLTAVRLGESGDSLDPRWRKEQPPGKSNMADAPAASAASRASSVPASEAG